MSSAWPVVIATSGWTRARAVWLSKPLTPGLKQAVLNARFVLSCLELVFSFMDYRNLLVQSVCLRVCMTPKYGAEEKRCFAWLPVRLIVWVYNG